MPNMVDVVQQISINAVEDAKPMCVEYGNVTGIAPLQIQIDQKITLEESDLILTSNVTDYTVEMSVDHETETSDGHSHSYKGLKEFTVNNALKIGEKVIMLRNHGGQQYLVLDRVR